MSWRLYDLLLETIPAGTTVDACLFGQGWTVVSSVGTGLAMNFRRDTRDGLPPAPPRGTEVRRVCDLLKSWDLGEASLGVAALNSVLNTPVALEAWTGRSLDSVTATSVFSSLERELEGKRVAVIGHFPDLDRLRGSCSLSILERNPQPGDLPDFAAEYVLPDQDYVFITGTALINKTLPRLLELSRDSQTVLVGPSVPLTPLWFDLGIDVLAGAVVVDPPALWSAVEAGGHQEIFGRGAVMVQMRASEMALRRGV